MPRFQYFVFYWNADYKFLLVKMKIKSIYTIKTMIVLLELLTVLLEYTDLDLISKVWHKNYVSIMFCLRLIFMLAKSAGFEE